MGKKIWSIILLCLIFVSLIFTAMVFVNTGISLYQEKNAEIDTSNDKLPGASIVGAAFASVGLWFGFVSLGGMISSIGFLCSVVNIKIAQNMTIKRISKAFSYFYLAVLALMFSVFVFFVISVF